VLISLSSRTFGTKSTSILFQSHTWLCFLSHIYYELEIVLGCHVICILQPGWFLIPNKGRVIHFSMLCVFCRNRFENGIKVLDMHCNNFTFIYIVGKSVPKYTDPIPKVSIADVVESRKLSLVLYSSLWIAKDSHHVHYVLRLSRGGPLKLIEHVLRSGKLCFGSFQFAGCSQEKFSMRNTCCDCSIGHFDSISFFWE